MTINKPLWLPDHVSTICVCGLHFGHYVGYLLYVLVFVCHVSNVLFGWLFVYEQLQVPHWASWCGQWGCWVAMCSMFMYVMLLNCHVARLLFKTIVWFNVHPWCKCNTSKASYVIELVCGMLYVSRDMHQNDNIKHVCEQVSWQSLGNQPLSDVPISNASGMNLSYRFQDNKFKLWGINPSQM